MSARQFSTGELLVYTTVFAVVLPLWYLAHRHPVAAYPARVLSGVLLCGPIGLALGGRKWFFPAMFVGGAVTSSLFRGKQPAVDKGSMPSMWKQNFGASTSKRYLAAFSGGVLLLFGARLAGGCTSGHMISGISQLALSSFIFGIATFAAAILMAKFLYRKRGV